MKKVEHCIIHWKRESCEDPEFDLRVAVRSLERFGGLERILVVGDRPQSVEGVQHVPYGHPYRRNKDANIMSALAVGAEFLVGEGGKLPEHVLIAADDCVLLRELEPRVHVEESFNAFMERFPERLKQNEWWIRPFNSMIHSVQSMGLADNCEAHVPQAVELRSLLKLREFPIGEAQLGAYTIPCNESINVPRAKARPFKLSPTELLDIDDLDSIPPGVRFCNWARSEDIPGFRDALLRLFPDPPPPPPSD